MKIKISEATPLQLDFAVARIEAPGKTTAWLLDSVKLYHYHPSSKWSQGGLIIEREKIDLFTEKKTYTESWCASVARYQNAERLVGWRLHQYGPTPLIAAMRCYVASKLGEEVDIPDDLSV